MVSWKIPIIVSTICSCFLFLCVSCAKKRIVYTGYEIHQFTPATHEDVAFLKHLETHNHGLIFMRPVSDRPGLPTEILVAPHLQHSILKGLQAKMKSKLLTDDVEKILDHDNHIRTLESIEENTFPFTTYWDILTYRSFLQNLQSSHPDICRIERYGTSSGPAEFPLEAMVVSTTLNDPSIKKRTMLVEGGTHSREWITIMSCSHFLNDVVTNFKDYAFIFQFFNFVFVCCVNPEGFAYSWDVNRFWRKTRSPTPMSPACEGVDPNRNYDFGFGGGGTSPDACSDVYHGGKPFSISETKNLTDYARRKNTRCYTTLHSYSQLLLMGYGCRSGNVPNQIYPTFQSDKALGTAAVDALTKVFGTPYKCDNSDAILYEACGTSQDWHLAKQSDYAWTYELRDTGDFGFALPASQILSCCQETTASLAVLHNLMARELVDRNMTKKDNGRPVGE